MPTRNVRMSLDPMDCNKIEFLPDFGLIRFIGSDGGINAEVTFDQWDECERFVASMRAFFAARPDLPDDDEPGPPWTGGPSREGRDE